MNDILSFTKGFFFLIISEISATNKSEQTFETLCKNVKRDFGIKFSSPEFCLPSTIVSRGDWLGKLVNIKRIGLRHLSIAAKVSTGNPLGLDQPKKTSETSRLISYD